MRNMGASFVVFLTLYFIIFFLFCFVFCIVVRQKQNRGSPRVSKKLPRT